MANKEYSTLAGFAPNALVKINGAGNDLALIAPDGLPVSTAQATAIRCYVTASVDGQARITELEFRG